GASLHVPGEEVRLSPERLLGWLAAEGITLCFLPTPLAERVVEAAERTLPACLRLRALLTGGDRLQRAPRRPLPSAGVTHYGRAEAAVVAPGAPVLPASPASPAVSATQGAPARQAELSAPLAAAAPPAPAEEVSPNALGHTDDLVVASAAGRA